MKKIILTSELAQVIKAPDSFFERSDVKLYMVETNKECLLLHMIEHASLIIALVEDPEMSGDKLCRAIRENDDMRGTSLMLVTKDLLLEEGSPIAAELLSSGANAVADISENGAKARKTAFTLLSIAKRTAMRIPVAIKIKGRRSGEPFIGYSVNISSTGMLFESETKIKEGEVIVCSFLAGDSLHIKTGARVVRLQRSKTEYGISHYGIKFSGMSEADKKALSKFVKEELKSRNKHNRA